MWSYEGALTLGSYMRRRDCLRTMAADLEVPESLAVPTAMRHILECLQVASHNAVWLILLYSNPTNTLLE